MFGMGLEKHQGCSQTTNTLKEPVCDLLAGKFLLSLSSIASQIALFPAQPPFFYTL
jgi:hypothetical protein